jgi:hypothetical protein
VAKTLEEVRALKASLEEQYRERHTDFELLRKFWHGKYWEVARSTTNTTLTSLFKDNRHTSGASPEMLIVHNLLQEVCVKYQTFLSTLPQISVYVDPPASQNKRNQANKKERYLYGLWDMGDMLGTISSAAWFLPLFGHAYLGCFPDPEQKIPTPVIRSPEHAYPIVSFDGSTEGVIFSWKIPESVARRNFGYEPPKATRPRLGGSWFARGPESQDNRVEILEYSDKDCWYRWVGDTLDKGVEHNFGWNVFDEMKFINVPGEPWGHGAVEQSVGMVHMGNHLYSLLMHAVLENVFPVIHIDNPQGLPEEMDFGPGGVVPTRDGGSVNWLIPPVQAVSTQVGFMERNEQAVKQATGMPDVMFGQSRASIQTGKSISQLQSAGTGSTVEMVQSIGLGDALVSWNAKAIEMTRQLWPNESIAVFGQRPAGMIEIKPERFAFTIKGSELVGSTRNDVTFLPHLDLHEKTVMLLQQQGAGLISRRFARDNIGIPDSEAMDEEMVGEAISDAVVQALVGTLAQAADPATAVQVEQEAVGYLAGSTHLQPAAPPAGQAPAPGLPTGAPGPLQLPGPAPSGGAAPGPSNGPPIGQIAPGAPGQAMTTPIQLPPGAPPPALAPGGPGASTGPGPAPAALPSGPAPGSSQGSDVVTVSDLSTLIGKLKGLKGKVYLIGKIVQMGKSADDIEIDVTVESDEQIISDGLPDLAPRLQFQVVSGPPDEPFVEVTPGVKRAPSGPGPTAIPGEIPVAA